MWVLLSLLAYALALEPLGFLLATFLLLVFLFRFGMEPQRWSWAIAGSAIASLSWVKIPIYKGETGVIK